MLEGFVTRYEFMRRRAVDEVDSVVDGGVEGLKKDLKEIRDLILMEDAGGGADGDTDGGDPGIIWSDASKVTTAEGDEANGSGVVLSMFELDILELVFGG